MQSAANIYKNTRTNPKDRKKIFAFIALGLMACASVTTFTISAITQVQKKSTLRKSNEKITDLRTELNDLNKLLIEKQNHNNALLEQIESFKQNASSDENQKIALSEKLQSLTQLVKKLELENLQINKTLLESNSKISTQNSSLEDLKTQKQNLLVALSKSKSEVQKYQQEIENVKNDLTKSATEAKLMSDKQISQLVNQLEQYKKDYVLLTEKYNQNLAEYNAKLITNKQVLDEEILRLQNVLNGLNAKYAAEKNELQARNNTLNEQRDRERQIYESRIDVITNENERNKKNISSLNKQVESLNNEKSILTEKIASAIEDKKQTEDKYKSMLGALNTKIDELNNANFGLNNNLIALQKENEEAIKKINELHESETTKLNILITQLKADNSKYTENAKAYVLVIKAIIEKMLINVETTFASAKEIFKGSSFEKLKDFYGNTETFIAFLKTFKSDVQAMINENKFIQKEKMITKSETMMLNFESWLKSYNLLNWNVVDVYFKHRQTILELRDEAAKLNQKIGFLQQTITNNQNLLTTSQGNLNKISRDLSVARSEIIGLKQDVKSKERTISQNELIIRNLKDDISKLRVENGDLVKYKKQLSEMTAKFNKSNDDLKLALSEIENKKALIETQNQKIQLLTNKETELTKQVQSLIKEKEQLATSIAELKTKIQSVESLLLRAQSKWAKAIIDAKFQTWKLYLNDINRYIGFHNNLSSNSFSGINARAYEIYTLNQFDGNESIFIKLDGDFSDALRKYYNTSYYEVNAMDDKIKTLAQNIKANKSSLSKGYGITTANQLIDGINRHISNDFSFLSSLRLSTMQNPPKVRGRPKGPYH
ncbi:hypothetical protein [Mycoplasma sp. 3341]|uniref:hypothetical protein n=1 Tax=Mycoplasma sp. 3341 TaxID=3447506 RepID=UPI003F65D272